MTGYEPFHERGGCLHVASGVIAKSNLGSVPGNGDDVFDVQTVPGDVRLTVEYEV